MTERRLSLNENSMSRFTSPEEICSQRNRPRCLGLEGPNSSRRCSSRFKKKGKEKMIRCSPIGQKIRETVKPSKILFLYHKKSLLVVVYRNAVHKHRVYWLILGIHLHASDRVSHVHPAYDLPKDGVLTV